MANVIQFTIRGKDKFSASMRRMGQSIARMGRRLRRVGKVAAIAGIALLGFVNSIANGIDDVAKFSTRLGISVEQLSKMQFVANQAGLSNTQFNLSVQRMTRRVSEAAAGTGEAKAALKELGINAKTFKDLKLEDQFAILSEKLSKAGSSSDQLRLAFKLFDSEGTAVLQMLKKGSADMRRLARDAEFLGLVISKQAAAKAEHFKDSMGRLWGSIKGVGRAIAGELMPVLSGLANRFANSMASNRSAIQSFTKSAILWVFTFIEIVKQIFQRIKDIFTGNEEALEKLFQGMVDFVKAVAKLFITLARVIFLAMWAGLKAVGKMVAGFTVWVWQKFKSAFGGDKVKPFAKAMAKVFSKAIGEAKTEIVQLISDASGTLKKEAKDVTTAFGDIVGVNLDLAKAKAKATIEKLSEFGTVAATQVNTVARKVADNGKKTLSEYEKYLKELKERSLAFTVDFFQLARDSVQSLSDAIGGAIVDGEVLGRSLKAIAKDVVRTFISMLVKMAIQRFILSKITNQANTSEAISGGAKAVGLAGANGVASMAGAPFPINLSAPAFGAAMAAAASATFGAGIATGGSIGATVGLGGIAHGGLTNVPAESTFLLNKGERVLSPNQNSDLKKFMSGGGGGGTTVIEKVEIHILENATSSDALLNMPKVEMEEVVAGPIMKALYVLDKRGIRLPSDERRGY